MTVYSDSEWKKMGSGSCMVLAELVATCRALSLGFGGEIIGGVGGT